MYKEEVEESRVHQCPKCKKRMGNSPDTIKRHDKEFCKPKKKTNATKSTPKKGGK